MFLAKNYRKKTNRCNVKIFRDRVDNTHFEITCNSDKKKREIINEYLLNGF
jgi:hypothetical protein